MGTGDGKSEFKPVRVKSEITGEFHYTYRGVKIDRWVNESGHFIGNTTMYRTAGTKFVVGYTGTWGNGTFRSERVTYDTLKGATRFIDRWLEDGKWVPDSRGRLIRAEVTA